MPTKGRPRLTEEQLRARITAYCARYGLAPDDQGLPPFPGGLRETPQHREWIAVYKAHDRLARRQRGQCERCPAPCSSDSVFCDAHRAPRADEPTRDSEACPVCARSLGRTSAGAAERLHKPCAELARLARPLGPEGLARLGRYLWPRGRPPVS